jgi:hypothetical protein
MNNVSEENILHLCVLIKGCEEPMINEQQRVATDMLLELARKGNPDAISALENLERFPWIHPHLREIIREGLQYFSLPAKSGIPEGNDTAPTVPIVEHVDGVERQVMSHATSHRDTQIENMVHSVKSITNSICSECSYKNKNPRYKN